MIKTHYEVRMANDGEGGNGLRYEFLRKHQDISFGVDILVLRILYDRHAKFSSRRNKR